MKATIAPTKLEQDAIRAMAKIHGNKFTLQCGQFMIHGAGYLTSFKLSDGSEWFVKVYDDNSEPKIYKLIE